MNHRLKLRLKRSTNSEEATPEVRTPNFYLNLFIAFAFLIVVQTFTNFIPFKTLQFFTLKWDWGAFLNIPWFLLLFGPLLGLAGAIFRRNTLDQNISILSSYKEDVGTSVLAGIFEEVSYRWIGFFLAIFSFYIGNWFAGTRVGLWITSNLVISIIFVVASFVLGIYFYIQGVESCMSIIFACICIIGMIVGGLALGMATSKALYTNILIPVVDWITQYKLSTYLHEYGWYVGAALISVNWNFGKGHVYQGPVGWINSWCFGMIMFWLTLNFGLPVAIVVHILYDVVLFSIRGADSLLEVVTETYSKN